ERRRSKQTVRGNTQTTWGLLFEMALLIFNGQLSKAADTARLSVVARTVSCRPPCCLNSPSDRFWSRRPLRFRHYPIMRQHGDGMFSTRSRHAATLSSSKCVVIFVVSLTMDLQYPSAIGSL